MTLIRSREQEMGGKIPHLGVRGSLLFLSPPLRARFQTLGLMSDQGLMPLITFISLKALGVGKARLLTPTLQMSSRGFCEVRKASSMTELELLLLGPQNWKAFGVKSGWTSMLPSVQTGLGPFLSLQVRSVHT